MPCRRRTGFTLVELLVVLGIIVVLVSILLPVLKSIREQGKSVSCSGNMHEILVAMNAYVSANDGALPVAPMATDSYKPTSTSQWMAYYMLSAPPPIIDYRDGKFWPYLGSSSAQATGSPPAQDRNQGVPDYRPRLFMCPSDDALALGRNFSYTWNFNTRFGWTNDKMPPGIDHLANIIEPVHKIVLEEEDKPIDGVGRIGDPNSTGTTPPAPAWRHSKRGNYGFADGHVETLGVSDVGYKFVYAANQPLSSVLDNKNTAAFYFRLDSNSPN